MLFVEGGGFVIETAQAVKLRHGFQGYKNHEPRLREAHVADKYCGLQGTNDVGEDITDGRAEQRQNDDDYDGDQHEDQGVFNETLTFFTRHVQHSRFLLPSRYREYSSMVYATAQAPNFLIG